MGALTDRQEPASTQLHLGAVSGKASLEQVGEMGPPGGGARACCETAGCASERSACGWRVPWLRFSVLVNQSQQSGT